MLLHDFVGESIEDIGHALKKTDHCCIGDSHGIEGRYDPHQSVEVRLDVSMAARTDGMEGLA